MKRNGGPATDGRSELRAFARFGASSWKRHPLLAFGSVAWVLLLTGISLGTLPWTWQSRAVILAQRDETLGQHVNPGRRGVGTLERPAKDAAEAVLAASSLLSIVERSHALESWRARSPAMRVKDELLQRLGTSEPSVKNEESGLVRILQTRLRVPILKTRLRAQANKDTVELTLDWPDRDGAVRILAAAIDNFFDSRRREELEAATAAVTILEQQIDEVDGQLKLLRGYRKPLPKDSLPTLEERALSLRRNLEDARLEVKAVGASFNYRYMVLQPSVALDEPVKPHLWSALLAALLGGLVVSLVAAVGADLRSGLVLDYWQFEREHALPALGEVSLPGQPGAPPGGGLRSVTLVGLLGLATAAVIWFSGGNVAAALVPSIAVAVAWFVLKNPLRYTVSTLLFLWLACDLRTDAGDLWHTPFHRIGDFFVDNLGTVIGVDALKVSGLELTLFGLIGVIAYRRATGSKLDSPGQVQTAGVLGDFVAVWLAALVFASINGLWNGARMEVLIWHARPMLAYVLMFFVYQAAFRGPADHSIIGRIVVAAALIKAVMAVYVMLFVAPYAPESFGPVEYATNHHDSITFALAATILLVRLAESTDRRRLSAVGWCLPILIAGMVANNRRLVWVELAMVLVTVYLVSPWRKWKKAATRFMIVGAPLVALYVAAGWTSSSALFKPVALLRSIADSKSDRSTLDRDAENWNLLLSMRERPFTGSGFGHEYTEYWLGDDISVGFPMYKAVPHNSVLGLLLFCGLIGFTGFWLILGVGVFLAARAYHLSRAPVDRAAALCCIATVLVVILQEYGDMGLIALQARVLLPLALVMAGKLAVATGAWPARKSGTRREARGLAST